MIVDHSRELQMAFENGVSDNEDTFVANMSKFCLGEATMRIRKRPEEIEDEGDKADFEQIKHKPEGGWLRVRKSWREWCIGIVNDSS